jgi:hypothetical protein
MKTTLVLALLMSCTVIAWTQNTKSNDVPSSPEQVAAKTITLKGDYRSYRGVMQTLSCHCFDGGVLTTFNGNKVNVCFEKGELDDYQRNAEKMQCGRLQVSGKMITHTIQPGKGDACTSGSISYLKVKSFKCLN